MTAKLLGSLPPELRAMVFKYLRHPLAEIFLRRSDVKSDRYSPFNLGMRDAINGNSRDPEETLGFIYKFATMEPDDDDVLFSTSELTEIDAYHDGYDRGLECRSTGWSA